MELPTVKEMLPTPIMSLRDFGERFIASKYGRPYRYKCRAARTNDRTNNKKKLRSVRAI